MKGGRLVFEREKKLLLPREGEEKGEKGGDNRRVLSPYQEKKESVLIPY